MATPPRRFANIWREYYRRDMLEEKIKAVISEIDEISRVKMYEELQSLFRESEIEVEAEKASKRETLKSDAMAADSERPSGNKIVEVQSIERAAKHDHSEETKSMERAVVSRLYDIEIEVEDKNAVTWETVKLGYKH